MSHNTTIKINCSMADIQSQIVQDMFTAMGWKFMKGGMYKGFGTQKGAMAEIRVAIPADQAGPYGERLSPTEAAQYGLTGNYMVVGINSSKGAMVEHKDPASGKPMMGPNGKPMMKEGPAQISVMLDDIGVEKVQKKIENAIKGAKFVHKIAKQAQILQKSGNPVSVNLPDIKKKVAQAIITGQKMKATNSLT